MPLSHDAVSGGFIGLDEETNAPIYSTGMLLPNLNDETIPVQYHEPIGGSSGPKSFLASLCLYFINNQENTDSFIYISPTSGRKYKDNLIFLEYFIFRHIPEADFRAAIARERTDEDKVKAICTLVHEKIRIPSGFCFYDLFESFKSSTGCIDSYQSKEKKIICCKCLMPLAQAKAQAGVAQLMPTLGGWRVFAQSCEEYGIDLSVEADQHQTVSLAHPKPLRINPSAVLEASGIDSSVGVNEYKNVSPTHPAPLLINPPVGLGEDVLDIAGLIASVNVTFDDMGDVHSLQQAALPVKNAFEVYANTKNSGSLESLNEALLAYQDAVTQQSLALAQGPRRFLQAVCIATVIIAASVGVAYLAAMPLVAAIGIGLAIVGIGAALGYDMKTRSRADTVINTARFFSQRIQTARDGIIEHNNLNPMP